MTDFIMKSVVFYYWDLVNNRCVNLSLFQVLVLNFP
jgi:hypothetical protein